MEITKVLLNSADKVRAFNAIVTSIDVDMDLDSGHVEIDAKSLVGTFALDLSRPIALCIHAEGEQASYVKNRLNDFIVD